MKLSEERLGELAVAAFTARGCDVYQEVQLGIGRADIVTVQGPIISIWELKKGPSLDLVAQLMRWNGWAHQVGAVTWSSASSAFGDVARRIGVAWNQVDERAGDMRAREGRMDWRAPHVATLKRALRPEHKTHAKAGSIGGGYWAPWRATVDAIVREAHANPGVTLADAMRRVKHHYSSNSAARAGAVFLFARGLVPGVRLEKVGHRVTLQISPPSGAAGTQDNGARRAP